MDLKHILCLSLRLTLIPMLKQILEPVVQTLLLSYHFHFITVVLLLTYLLDTLSIP